MSRLLHLAGPVALVLAACTAPQNAPMPPNLAAQFTSDERAALAAETAKLDAALRGDCTARDLHALEAFLPYVALNLAAAVDEALRNRLTADAALTAQAQASRDARLRISRNCDDTLKESTWGYL